MEYGSFRRRNSGNHQRNFDRRERGGGNRERGAYRERDAYRERGNWRDRGEYNHSRNHEGEESVFSKRVKAGKRRTYFFDVRKTRGNDYFITITESTRREDGYGYRRHKIFLYKEDFNRFVASLNEVVEHVKTDLMPDFDYEEFDRRQAEWEAQQQNQSGEDERADDFAEFEDEDFDEEDFEDEDLDEEEQEENRPGRKSSARKNPPEDDDISW